MIPVIFDLDGVLVDSRLAYARCINHALVAHGLSRRPDDELHAFIGPPLFGTFGQLLGARRDEPGLLDGCVESYRRRYRDRAAQETTVFDGMLELVAELAAQRPVAVATAKPQALAEPLLEALGLRPHLTVVAGPALDAQAEDKADTLGRALAGLGVEEAIMVGDRRYDVAAAHAHGLRVVGITWGIGSRAELEAAGSDVIVDSPQALRDALAGTG